MRTHSISSDFQRLISRIKMIMSIVVAQRIEQAPSKRKVVGSNPTDDTKETIAAAWKGHAGRVIGPEF